MIVHDSVLSHAQVDLLEAPLKVGDVIKPLHKYVLPIRQLALREIKKDYIDVVRREEFLAKGFKTELRAVMKLS